MLEGKSAFVVLGPDLGYHVLDPYLPGVLQEFQHGMTLDDILSFRSERRLFDLCFEDTWSGYFLAEELDSTRDEGDLVLVHLDHHQDMMPTLLVRSGDGLSDPTTLKHFDPAKRADWVAAIYSGSVGIGSFITPLYYGNRRVHVRHIHNHAASDGRTYEVAREFRSYAELPEMKFAALRKSRTDERDPVGTFSAGNEARAVLRDLPRGSVVVHIDLDYFINDFDGHPRTGPYYPPDRLRHDALAKMEAFFRGLREACPDVSRWVVATSPGFCSAVHWTWLLNEIEVRVRRFREERNRPALQRKR